VPCKKKPNKNLPLKTVEMNRICFFNRPAVRKSFILWVLCITLGSVVKAQNPVLLECMNINKAYLDTAYLSFNIKYKYAYEATPTVFQDSSLAAFKLNGYKYWGKIDSVEFMQNDSFMVSLFKEDQILSLGLPGYSFNKSLPLGQWDSLFFQNDRFSFTTGVDAGLKKITVDYDANLPYKKFEMWYDSVSYRISRIKYLVSEFASEPDFYSLPGPGSYGVVDMSFTNYQVGAFGDEVFLASTYITHSGTGYTPSGMYETYELYITSPALLK
jgi:hypothetical protein